MKYVFIKNVPVALLSDGYDISSVWPGAYELFVPYPLVPADELAEGDFRANLPLEDLRQLTGYSFSVWTKARIDRYLPDWRMARWKTYAALHEKLDGGSELNARERQEYDAFLDAGETHEVCYNYVCKALGWAADMVAAHKVAESRLVSAQSVEDIIDIVPDYPAWPL